MSYPSLKAALSHPDSVEALKTGSVGVASSAGSVVSSLLITDEILRTATLLVGFIVACLSLYRMIKQMRRRKNK